MGHNTFRHLWGCWEVLWRLNGTMDNDIKENELLFPIGERAVQKYLNKVSDYLRYENIGIRFVFKSTL